MYLIIVNGLLYVHEKKADSFWAGYEESVQSECKFEINGLLYFIKPELKRNNYK